MENSEILLRLAVAVAFGGLLGLEREYRKKSAGFRTMILISVGSAVLTIIALEIYAQFPQSTDPTRIISYIVSGIGFLGAGVIMKHNIEDIKGITTAAAIWMVAALGMTAGAGFFFLGTVASLTAFVALFLLPYFEIHVSRMNEYNVYRILVKDADFLESIDQVFHDNNLKLFMIKRSKNEEGYILKAAAYGKPQDHEKVSWIFIDHDKVISFDN